MKSALEYLRPQPSVVFGKSVITLKVTIGTTPTVLVDNNRGPNAYAMLIINAATPIYIGGQGVTIASGFPVDASQLFTFGMLENTKLWAVAETDLDVYILDMGL